MARIDGTPEGDFLFGTDGGDVIDALAGDDTVFAGDGDDRLLGGAGNDILNGEAGADVLEGGIGDDVLSGDDLPGQAASDRLTGGAGVDTFAWRLDQGGSTSAVRDVVTDFAGAGATGGDTLLLQLPERDQRSLVFDGRLAAPLAQGGAFGKAGDGIVNVGFAIQGSNTIVFADTNDDGIFGANDFTVQLAGRQNLTRADFGDTRFVTFGTERNDTLVGGASNDVIRALGGNDTVLGLGGDDLIEGGTGNDLLFGGTGNDRIEGGDGADLVIGEAGDDRLLGGAGEDRLLGGDGDDRLFAGDGNDFTDGGAGDDEIVDDAGDDLIHGGSGDDEIFGQAGNDQLFGDAGTDDLFGGDGADRLDGGAGNDTLLGEAGADILTGGRGNDSFEFFAQSSSFGERDRITDFEGAGVRGGDAIDLSGSYLFLGNTNFDAVEGAALSGAGNGVVDLAYTFRNGKTFLVADENDNGVLDADDFSVEFNGRLNLAEQDFASATFFRGGTAGADTLTGTEGDDQIAGLGGRDRILGLGGNDLLRGGTGNDIIDSGTGFDTLLGEDGNDTLILREFGSASGGTGDDRLFSSDVEGSFNELLGGAGRDELTAGSGGATLDGGEDADRLVSGSGNDFLQGGSGTDSFVFGRTWGSDFIADFEVGIERIDLRASGVRFEDLTITSEDDGQTTIASAAGTISLSTPAIDLTDWDFIFA